MEFLTPIYSTVMESISWINTRLYLILSSNSFTTTLIAHKTSSVITICLIYLLIFILIYEAVMYISIQLNLMEAPGKEFFIDTPVHCAHVYIRLNICSNAPENNYYSKQAQFVLKKPLVYNLEFGPMDYDPKNPDLGTTLQFTKEKTLTLFQNSVFYQKHPNLNEMTTKDLHFYHHKKELKNETEFLCLLGVETGHKVDCFIDLSEFPDN